MEEVLHRNADPIKVKLVKGQKDTYGWEISVQGKDRATIIYEVEDIDGMLRNIYGTEEGK